MLKPPLKNALSLFICGIFVSWLGVFATGCRKPVDDPVAKQLKIIAAETREFHKKAVTDLDAGKMTPARNAETMEWFEIKKSDVRALMNNAVSGDAKVDVARVASNCVVAENLLTTAREAYRRRQTGDTASEEMTVDLAKTYLRQINALPAQTPPDSASRSEKKSAQSRPNIILIVADTLRADHLGAYGYGRNTSPFIDSLAKQGVLYENAYSQAPHTPASVATILTGTYPSKHRLVSDCEWESGLNLAKDFKKAGYRTAAFSANPIVSRKNGYGEGFDSFAHRPEAIAEVLANEVFIWLNSHSLDKPVFIYLQFMDPHESYNAPPPFTNKYNPGHARRMFTSWIYGSLLEEIKYDFDPDKIGWIPEDKAYELIKTQLKTDISRKDVDGELDYYDGEISYMDDVIGKMFATLKNKGLLDNAIVAFASDHGEGFMEHGFMEHGNVLYDEMTHVPLILWDNEKTFKSGRVSSIVEMTDVMPTLLSAAGISIPPSAEGTMLPKPGGRANSGKENIAFSSTWYGWSFKDKKNIRKFSARTSSHKLIYTPRENLYELYDLEKDPAEKKNIMTKPGEAVPDNLLSELSDYVRKFNWNDKKAGGKKTNPGLKKDMKTLGYIR